MTLLGEMLEALHSARSSLGPVEGVVHEWRNEQLVSVSSDEEWDEAAENRRYTAENEFEQLTEFKLAPPDRLRVETRVPERRPASVVVCDGSRRTTWIADWGTEVEDQSCTDVGWVLGPGWRLLDPSWLLGALEFDPPRRTSYGGEPVLRVSARPRYRLAWPFGPADTYELVIDPLRGTVLRLAGLMHRAGETLVHEVVELRHDAVFDDDAFSFVPDGEVSGLGLREAASLASFGVWALPRPILDATYRSEPVESLTLTYEDALLVLVPASERIVYTPFDEPTPHERGGTTYWLSERQVAFAIEEVWLRLSHATALGEELLDLAETVVRVPG